MDRLDDIIEIICKKIIEEKIETVRIIPSFFEKLKR